MSKIRINSIQIENYRSFGKTEKFEFPDERYKKPIAITGYNNSGKTNLMNSLKFGLYERVSEDTFTVQDFHKCEWQNSPYIELKFTADIGEEKLVAGVEYTNWVRLNIEDAHILSVEDVCNASNYKGVYLSKKWAIKQRAPIFYINFHNIKDELSTKKTSWGNLTSFLAKHIKKIVDIDDEMQNKRENFNVALRKAKEEILENSELQLFINSIRENYKKNLRDNNCEVDFSLPDYEDIFLKMVFKIGLGGRSNKKIPVTHFGDGYISMFVMAVIQAIAETENEDKCLFLFEEPESFLHENHQEYFYKTVLCALAEKGHQVIYTTHSDKMLDIFDTRSLIRLEFDELEQRTVKKYNDASNDPAFENIINLKNYSQYIRSIEPNLNKIIFSKKVLLVEGPDDLLAYTFSAEYFVGIKKSENKYAEAYLNFKNIAIIPHHGKTTARLIVELCKHLKVNYFVVSDWDYYKRIEVEKYTSLEELHQSAEYLSSENSDVKATLTNNWNLINDVGSRHIHFNFPKLEAVLGFQKAKPEDDLNLEYINKGDSIKIWEKLEEIKNLNGFSDNFFPNNLVRFLEIDTIENTPSRIEESEDDIPF